MITLLPYLTDKAPLPRRVPRRQGFAAPGVVRAVLVVVLVIANVGAPHTALAAESGLAEAEAAATKAAAFFKAGLFDQAAEAYMQAYAHAKLPLMLYNAARAHEEGGKLAEARALFVAYLKLGGLSDADRAAAQARIAGLDARLVGAKPAGKAMDADVDATKTASSAATSQSGVWKWVGAGAFGAAGLGAYLIARAEVADANQMPMQSTADKRAYQDQTDTAKRWRATGIGLAAAGGALAVWGLIDALRSGDRSAAIWSERRWSVAPAVGNGSSGLVVDWHWK